MSPSHPQSCPEAWHQVQATFTVHPPVTLQQLHTLRSRIKLDTPFDAAVWATALCSFFGCRRLGETTVPSAASFDPVLHCTRGAECKFSSIPSGPTSLSIHLPWTKTTRSDGFTVVLTARNDVLCPVAAFLNHLHVNFGAPADASLFAYKNSEGCWSHMLKKDFLSSVTSIWNDSGSPQISGHCFRIGGAVSLLLSGVAPEVVAATGGWTSMAFLLYWRRMEDIISINTSSAYSYSQIDQLSSTMTSFRSSIDSAH
ncbi:hypothetical protein AGABI1DRAFT_132977 [Agaricus bisporus var. burnettii JB137-S8]|uniref:Tyr recombinase domain-containing protein n=1 Tax=Agaricus bisporus var. burnettii (strain JB137-S8 / ATCC MYA-4627 / FGSC 10392) TaxID=597362 RepID=K5XJQ3_AGABU|nr:uncharacterized protein AGABI1DRAFT_132977 [Agaricus bisporus var. burnettii JB137-S8]EKM74720.1 hypothetical protein AGABI1DRAFT_132977 [Agaricus bisporus var. burnettii JB137-S8]